MTILKSTKKCQLPNCVHTANKSNPTLFREGLRKYLILKKPSCIRLLNKHLRAKYTNTKVTPPHYTQGFMYYTRTSKLINYSI